MTDRDKIQIYSRPTEKMSTISPNIFCKPSNMSNNKIYSTRSNTASSSSLTLSKLSSEVNLNSIPKKHQSESIFQFRLSRYKKESLVLDKMSKNIEHENNSFSMKLRTKKSNTSQRRKQEDLISSNNNNNTKTEFVFKNAKYKKYQNSRKCIEMNSSDESTTLNKEIASEHFLNKNKSPLDSFQSTEQLPVSGRISANNKIDSDEENVSLNEINLYKNQKEFAVNKSNSNSCPNLEAIDSYNASNNANKKYNAKSRTKPSQKELAFTTNSSVGTSKSHFTSIVHNSTEMSISFEKNLATSSSNNFNSTTVSNFSEESLFVTNESYSEYLPESTNTNTVTGESFRSSKKSLEGMDDSVKEITSPIDITKVHVPYSSKTKSKKHFCIFCKILQTNLARHLLLKHKSEKEIKAILKLPKKHTDRVKVFNKLRKEGNFLHNTTKSLNTGILIVSRQQHAKAKNEADDYVCCKICKGFFSKKTLRIHLPKCGNPKRNDRTNFISSRRLTQYIHEDANEILKTKIFPILRDDSITSAIRYDDLIIKYGNKLAEKYTLMHQHDMIRSHLRLLGRYKIAICELSPDIEYFKDIYKPQMFNTCIKALRKVANWDNMAMWFKTPAVAQSLTSLVKKCGCKQRTEFIKIQEEQLKKDLEDFLLLWNEDVPTLINKKALEDQANQKRDKKLVLPSKEDIKKLYLFLKNRMIANIKVLEDTFCLRSWNELIKSTLIFIQIFNRRAGEIERLTIANYENKEVITDNMDEDLIRNISKDSLEFAKQFVRILIRGKLGRTVSVLLNPLSVTAIDLIIKYRTSAGISTSNGFIFCKKGFSKLSKLYYRACPLLKQFSMECGADIPETLRGTTLRKHIATYTSLLNIEEAAVDTLANFMGHHKDIHKKVYRQSIPVAEITCVSKLLMNAIVDEDNEQDDNICDNVVNEEAAGENHEESSADEQSENEESNISANNRKRRSKSPYGKTKRFRWTEEERQAIFAHFGCLKNLEKLPNLSECKDPIEKFPILERRTPYMIKSWIDNQRRYK